VAKNRLKDLLDSDHVIVTANQTARSIYVIQFIVCGYTSELTWRVT